MSLTPDDVKKVARLARLKITPEEAERFLGQLDNILGHMKDLAVLDTSKVEPTAHALGLSLPTVALAWFVGSGRVFIPGDIGGVEGSQQFGLFLAGAASATIITAIAASITQWGRPVGGEPAPGMEGLRRATAFQLLRRRFSRAGPAPGDGTQAHRR